VDPPGVLTVLGNLLDNAMDAAPGGRARPPWVEVALVTEPGGALRIRVDDSGPGVPPPDRERIFEAGYSTKAPGTSGARGVGLPLVRRTVEHRGGAVRVGPAAGGGARFEVELPEAVGPEPVEPLLESEAGAVAW
jgi:two-component system CitB family sensor kinase